VPDSNFEKSVLRDRLRRHLAGIPLIVTFRRDSFSWCTSRECRKVVGSSTGAVIRRKLLVCVRRFHLRARLGDSVIPFPAPATSHAACGFPALRAPAHFSSRVMKLIVSERLSAAGALDSHQTNRARHTTIADSTASNRSLDAIGLWPSDAESSARPSCE
jgi:hypothetical protein